MGASAFLYYTEQKEQLKQMRLLHGNFIGLFMIFLLPAIILEAGYNMQKVFF